MTGKKKPARPARAGSSSAWEPYRGERELIVIARAEASLRARGTRVESAAGRDVRALAASLARESATLVPLFGASEERVLRSAARVRAALAAEMASSYRVQAADERLEALAVELRAHAEIAAAYVKPPSEPAGLMEFVLPLPGDPPAVTPDFSARQGYLGAAPGGIHARFAWARPGGAGTDVRIIDVEGDWRFSHEDLLANQGGLVAGKPANDLKWRNHGTAVLGEISGDHGAFGVSGICPAANVRAVSVFGLGSALAIRSAADLLSAGDIMLIEQHRAGPHFHFQQVAGPRGYIPIEWWPDDFAAVQYATSLGVLVVAVGGNGAEDLDDALYDEPGPGFPESWANPFRRVQDSGAILVGAGAPPPGTHGRDHGPDRSRLQYSNFGACIDAQGWGHEVTTCGYGDLQGGANEDLWYADTFAGTSAASPMIVGALGALQGALRAAGQPLLTPATARALLRSTGTPQLNAPGRPATQRIGNRPDLRQAFGQLGIAGLETKPVSESAKRSTSGQP